METRSQYRGMKPQGTLPSAPSGEPGADFKTASWGGPNDGSAGLSLAGPEGPMGPRIAASMLLSASVAELPNGLVVRRYKRLAMYRTSSFDGVVRLVAELLFKVSRIARGSVVYVNAGKITRYLGLDAPFHPVDLSVVYATMARLGFEIVEVGRGKAVMINMRHPLIEKIKAVESINEVVEIIKRYLGE